MGHPGLLSALSSTLEPMSTPPSEHAAESAAVRVAIMNDYEVVVQGVRRMLEPFEGRVRVVELDSGLPVESPVDVLLYDAFTRERVVGPVAEVLATTAAPAAMASRATVCPVG